MKYHPFWEANIPEIRRILWQPKFPCCVYNCPRLGAILTRTNPAYPLKNFSLNSSFNMTFSKKPAV